MGRPDRLLLPFALAFVVLNLAATDPTRFAAGRPRGDQNALSRFATLRAMSREGRFRIDPYRHWTQDWSRTPEGRYYSNKPPGPMFLAFPVFFVLDRLAGGEAAAPVAAWIQKVCAFLFQMAPMVALVAWAVSWLRRRGGPPGARLYLVAALFFGHTAAVFMNCFFGHALTAVLVTAAALALVEGRILLAGLAYGFALLSDYGAATLLPGLLLALAVRGGAPRRWLPRLALGALLPAALWCWYHTAAFGSPLRIASHYQNPLFLDTRGEAGNLWGIFVVRLRPRVLLTLLAGPSRGILFTQPWVLLLVPVAAAWALRRRSPPERRALGLFAALGFLLLLAMNSCFGAWHGGWSPGPRYMSPIFPVFALLAGWGYGSWPGWFRGLLWAGLLVSLAAHGQVLATHVLVPREAALWVWQWEHILRSPRAAAKLLLFWVLLAAAFGAARRS